MIGYHLPSTDKYLSRPILHWKMHTVDSCHSSRYNAYKRLVKEMFADIFRAAG